MEKQLARWLERLQQYNFEIVHRAGKSHGNADALSRRPCAASSCNYCNKVESKEEEAKGNSFGRIIFEESEPENWRKAQLEDPILATFYHRKEEDRRPLRHEISSGDPSMKIYWSQWDSLVLKDRVLRRKWKSSDLKSTVFQTLVSRKMVQQILEEALADLVFRK